MGCEAETKTGSRGAALQCSTRRNRLRGASCGLQISSMLCGRKKRLGFGRGNASCHAASRFPIARRVRSCQPSVLVVGPLGSRAAGGSCSAWPPAGASRPRLRSGAGRRRQRSLRRRGCGGVGAVRFARGFVLPRPFAPTAPPEPAATSLAARARSSFGRSAEPHNTRLHLTARGFCSSGHRGRRPRRMASSCRFPSGRRSV